MNVYSGKRIVLSNVYLELFILISVVPLLCLTSGAAFYKNYVLFHFHFGVVHLFWLFYFNKYLSAATLVKALHWCQRWDHSSHDYGRRSAYGRYSVCK